MSTLLCCSQVLLLAVFLQSGWKHPNTFSVNGQEFGFELNGQFFDNNSVVSVSDIGSGEHSLMCTTNSTACCRSVDTKNKGVGEWFLPSGHLVVGAGRGIDADFIRKRRNGSVSLNRRNESSSLSGIFLCQLPTDSNGTVFLYVGLYPQGQGHPHITDLNYDLSSLSLRCVSTGGLVNSVTWLKNDVVLIGDDFNFQQNLQLIDRVNSTYESILSLESAGNASSLIGTFTCIVGNIIGNSTKEIIFHVPEEPIVEIVSTDFPTAGKVFILTCRVTLRGYQNFNVSPNSEWLYPDGHAVNNSLLYTAIQNDFLIHEITLMFNPLHTSHAGKYVCRSTLDKIYSTSFNLVVQIPKPMVSIFSTPFEDNPFTGLQLNLTCSIELDPVVVDTPVMITGEWTKSNLPLTVDSDIIIKEMGVIKREHKIVYEILLVFDYLQKFRDDGNYTCTATVTDIGFNQAKISASLSYTIIVETIVFQIRLTGIHNCINWREDNTLVKVDEIVSHIIVNLEQRCECDFAKDRITNLGFLCFPNSPQAVSFRAVLHGTDQASASKLISYFQQWISMQASISIQAIFVNIDNRCSGIIDTLDDRECPQQVKVDSNPSDSPRLLNLTAVIAGITSVVVVIVLVIILLLVVLYAKNHLFTKKVTLKTDVELSKRSCYSSTEHYITEQPLKDQEHEYEEISKYTGEYAEIKPLSKSDPISGRRGSPIGYLQPVSPSELPNTYTYADCPAYATTTLQLEVNHCTGVQHGAKTTNVEES